MRGKTSLLKLITAMKAKESGRGEYIVNAGVKKCAVRGGQII